MIGSFRPITGVMAGTIGRFTLPGDNAGFCDAILRKSAGSAPLRLESLTYVRAADRETAAVPSQQPLVVNLLMQLRTYYDQSNTFLRSQTALNLQLTQQLRQALASSNGAVRTRAGEIERAVRENLYRDGEFKRAVDGLARELKKNDQRTPELTVWLPGPAAAPGSAGSSAPGSGEVPGVRKRETPVLRASVFPAAPPPPALEYRHSGQEAAAGGTVSRTPAHVGPAQMDGESAPSRGTGTRKRSGAKRSGRRTQKNSRGKTATPEMAERPSKRTPERTADRIMAGGTERQRESGRLSRATLASGRPTGRENLLSTVTGRLVSRAFRSPVLPRFRIWAGTGIPGTASALFALDVLPGSIASLGKWGIPALNGSAIQPRVPVVTAPALIPRYQETIALVGGQPQMGSSFLPMREIPDRQNSQTQAVAGYPAAHESATNLSRRQSAAWERSIFRTAAAPSPGGFPASAAEGSRVLTAPIPLMALSRGMSSPNSEEWKETTRAVSGKILGGPGASVFRRPWHREAAASADESVSTKIGRTAAQLVPRAFQEGRFPTSRFYRPSGLPQIFRTADRTGHLPAAGRGSFGTWLSGPEEESPRNPTRALIPGVAAAVPGFPPVSAGILERTGFQLVSAPWEGERKTETASVRAASAPVLSLTGRARIDGRTEESSRTSVGGIVSAGGFRTPVTAISRMSYDVAFHPSAAGKAADAKRTVYPEAGNPTRHLHQWGVGGELPAPVSGTGERLTRMRYAVRNILKRNNADPWEIVRQAGRISEALSELEAPAEALGRSGGMPPSRLISMRTPLLRKVSSGESEGTGAGGVWTFLNTTGRPEEREAMGRGPWMAALSRKPSSQPQSTRRAESPHPAEVSFPTGMIHRQPERQSNPVLPATAGDSGEAVLQAQTVRPSGGAAAMNAAYSYPPGGRGVPARGPEETLTKDEEDRITRRVLEDINYNRMADEVLDRVERRLRAERRKFGR